MSGLSSGKAGRRRRADAERSVAAILDAAVRVLGKQPDASMDDVAKAAGISRQTVYAHFKSRDTLVNALLNRVTERVVAAIDAAKLDEGPAIEALVRLLEVGWAAFEGDPFLLQLSGPPVTAEEERDRHEPILGRLENLIERGRRSGEFDVNLTTSWIIAATLALGRAAGEEVRAGRMTPTASFDQLRRSLPRLFSASPPS